MKGFRGTLLIGAFQSATFSSQFVILAGVISGHPARSGGAGANQPRRESARPMRTSRFGPGAIPRRIRTDPFRQDRRRHARARTGADGESALWRNLRAGDPGPSQSSKIATARVNPAEAPLIFQGKQAIS